MDTFFRDALRGLRNRSEFVHPSFHAHHVARARGCPSPSTGRARGCPSPSTGRACGAPRGCRAHPRVCVGTILVLARFREWAGAPRAVPENPRRADRGDGHLGTIKRLRPCCRGGGGDALRASAGVSLHARVCACAGAIPTLCARPARRCAVQGAFASRRDERDVRSAGQARYHTRYCRRGSRLYHSASTISVVRQVDIAECDTHATHANVNAQVHGWMYAYVHAHMHTFEEFSASTLPACARPRSARASRS